MIRKFFLVFIVLASIFSAEHITTVAPQPPATTELVVTLVNHHDQQQEHIVTVAERDSSPELFLITAKTLRGVTSTRHLIECQQYHSSLSC